MKVYEKIQKVINELSDGLEMAGFLDALNMCAIVHCKQHCSDEVYTIKGGESRVSVLGMAAYLNSEVDSDNAFQDEEKVCISKELYHELLEYKAMYEDLCK